MNRRHRFVRPARAVARGMTLIELMIGLAVIALLMAPLAALLSNSATGGAVTALQLDLQNQAQFAIARIDRQIQASSNTQLSQKTNDASSGSWLAPATYSLAPGTMAGTQGLYETIGGNARLLAEPVSAFSVTSPGSTTGQTLIAVSLTLTRGDAIATVTDVARVGGAR